MNWEDMTVMNWGYRYGLFWALVGGFIVTVYVSVLHQKEGGVVVGTMLALGALLWGARCRRDRRVYRNQLIREIAKRDARRSIR
jgi:hypothetical protein